MPVNSPVHKLYAELLSKGMSQKDAAKIAQSKTGLALVTGRPPKSKGHGAQSYGQYK